MSAAQLPRLRRAVLAFLLDQVPASNTFGATAAAVAQHSALEIVWDSVRRGDLVALDAHIYGPPLSRSLTPCPASLALWPQDAHCRYVWNRIVLLIADWFFLAIYSTLLCRLLEQPLAADHRIAVNLAVGLIEADATALEAACLKGNNMKKGTPGTALRLQPAPGQQQEGLLGGLQAADWMCAPALWKVNLSLTNGPLITASMGHRASTCCQPAY